VYPIRSGHALEGAPPVRIISGSEPGGHPDILSLKRTEGGLLTLHINRHERSQPLTAHLVRSFPEQDQASRATLS
jgi:hypothetical protein